MPTVRFTDAARYATKLFGYILAVVVVSAGAVSLGYYILRPEIAPTLGRGTADKPALIGGAALIIVGSVIFSVGAISATYKLIADAVRAGGTATTAEAAGDAVEEPAAEPAATGASADALGPSAAARESARQAETAEPPAETPAMSEPGAGAETAGGNVAGADETGSGVASTTGMEPETSPDPPERETTPDPPERETSPEPPERETNPEPPERETNPEPPRSTGADEAPPEPSAEEIAFGSSGGDANAEGQPAVGGEEPTDTGEGTTETGEEPTDIGEEPADIGEQPTDIGGTEDDIGGGFTSKSVEADEEESTPMWSDEPDDGGFEDPPIEDDVDAVETESEKDPLADDE